jgi:hypothetical protein
MIRLESALSEGQGLKSALKKKRDRVCKEKYYLFERPFKVVRLYHTTSLLVEFKIF